MSQSVTSDDLKYLFTYPFQDPEWTGKFLVGSLVVFAGFIIPVVPFIAVYGYMAAIMREAIESGRLVLPRWDDWGKLFSDGFKLFAAIFLLMLPIMLLAFCGFGAFFGLVGLSAGVAENSDAAALGPMLGMIIWFATMGLIMLLGIAIGVLMPVLMAHVVATGQISAAFRIKELWALFRANTGGFLMAYLVVIALSMVLSMAISLLYFTIILCCIVPFVMAPVTLYLMVIQGAIFGQAYREGQAKMAAKA